MAHEKYPHVLRESLAASVLLTLGFLLTYWAFYGNFDLSGQYREFMAIFISVWLVLALYFKIYRVRLTESLRFSAKLIALHSFTAFLIINILVVALDIQSISRAFFLSISGIALGFEYLGLLISKRHRLGNFDSDQPSVRPKVYRISDSLGIKKAAFSLSILIASALGVVYIAFGWIDNYPYLNRLLVVLISMWLTSALMTGKFKAQRGMNVYYKISPHTKSYILIFLFAGAYHFLTRQGEIEVSILFGSILLSACLELTTFYLWFNLRAEDIAELNVQQSIASSRQSQLSAPGDTTSESTSLISEIDRYLYRLLDDGNESIITFVNGIITNAGLEKDRYSVIYTNQPENIKVADLNSFGTIINVERLNNIRFINQYLIYCHNALIVDGYLFGMYEPLEKARENFRKRMPRFLYTILYPIHFLFHRVLPKLPKIKQLYFILTKGQNRKISRAEVMGRLSYCGFSDIEEVSEDGFVFFAAKKTKTISTVSSPSYGPIIGLERVCLHGEIKRIYKFRTMHPFSEFIQKEIFERNNLAKNGKVENDFRRTYWGTVLRKYWLDELPQLWNWLKGDLTFYGVRALSEHYFSLYPEELKELRIQHKPGLLPPYYADLPQNFEEILDSERQYLLRKASHPIRTDLSYILRTMYNIILKGARSS